jgi:hypothetical protein
MDNNNEGKAQPLPERKLTTAEELFWHNMKAAAQSTTEKFKVAVEPITRRLEKIDKCTDEVNRQTKETNSFFGAMFSGLGQMVAERKAKKK